MKSLERIKADVTCPSCSGPKSGTAKLCPSCQHAKNWVSIVCPDCGKAKDMYRSHAKQRKTHYCRACSRALSRLSRPARSSRNYQERDMAIMDLVHQGLMASEIGRQFKVTRERVRQIAKKNGISSLRHAPKTSTICPNCGGVKTRAAKLCPACRHAECWVSVVCPGCGKTREIERHQVKRLKSHYCRTCYFKSKTETRPCAWCGEPITRRRSAFHSPVALHSNTDSRHCLAWWRVSQMVTASQKRRC